MATTETMTEKKFGDIPATRHLPSEHTLDEAATKRRGRAPSRWALKSWRERTFWEQLAALDIGPPDMYFTTDKDRGEVPVHPIWLENTFILGMGLLPVWLQAISYRVFPSMTWNPYAAYAIYTVGMIAYLIVNLKRLHKYSIIYGTFDEKVRGRDLISDKQVDKLGYSLLLFISIRTIGPFLMAYDRNEVPTFSLLSPIKVGLWLTVLDYFFYCYHRSCHEVPALWFIHRAHHGTKHPTGTLSILADDWQEVIEVISCPLLASACVQLKFHEAWAAVAYLIYVEMLGHSGIRAHWSHPILSYFLAPFDMELAVEDHELHHRYGRGGKNYGKQTRIYDQIFGTVAEREETRGIGYGH